MVRIGIIGLGNIGKIHFNNIIEKKVKGAMVTGVYNPNIDKLEKLKEEVGEKVKYFTNLELFFKSKEFDGIIVCSPHYEHPEQCKKALKNGYHVLSEKPVGVYSKEVEELIEISKDIDQKFAIVYNQRTEPVYRKLKEMVENKEIGEIKRINWIVTQSYRTQSYYDSNSWRATWGGEGGGVLLNQSFHQLDLLQWICGMPKKVTGFCQFGKERDIEVETDATIYIEYENGATGVFITSTIDCPGTNRLEITGDKGKIVMEDGKVRLWKLEISEREYNQKTNKQTFDSSGKFLKPEFKEVKVNIEKKEKSRYVVIVENWIKAIKENTPLVADGVEGINALTIVNAAYLSSFLGKSIELPMDNDLFLEELNKKTKNSKVKRDLLKKNKEINQ